MVRHLSIIVAFVALSTVPALAQSDTVTAKNMQLHALSGLSQAPPALSDKELAAIDGQGIVLANQHATPGLPFPNPGTAIAVGNIPSFVGQNLWFGKAAGK